MNLLGMTLAELKNLAIELGMPAFTGSQIAKWLYSQHVETIDGMTNISKSNREKLKNVASINLMPYEDAQYSVDGTIKYLFPTESGKCVETVYIPDGDRATLCVSSQVGCRMGCLSARLANRVSRATLRQQTSSIRSSLFLKEISLQILCSWDKENLWITLTMC